MELIDTHCHLDIREFDEDRLSILDNCNQLGIKGMIMPGIVQSGWHHLLQLSTDHQQLFAAPGLHPCFLENVSADALSKLESLLQKSRLVVAVGEIGMDFHMDGFDEEKQKLYFREQVNLAANANLPLILHVRKAHDQVISILKRMHFSQGGVVHCYSGSLQQATNYLSLGFKIGIGGVVTYPRSARLRKIAGRLPLDSFVLETDAPDIPVCGQEKERNRPENLIKILDAFSERRSESRDAVIEQLHKTTLDLFPRIDE
jgi:TatD DNase family protein